MNFGSEFFAANRARLKTLFTGTAPIVLTANGLLQKIVDEPYPFRQDGNFWYLTGCEAHNALLVMDKDREYMIVPGRDKIIESMDGGVDKEALSAKSGITDIVDETEGWRRLRSRLKRVQHVATLSANPAYIEILGMYTNPARRRLIRKIKDINPDIELLDLKSHFQRMRAVKQPVELETIKRAINITADTLKEVTRPSRLNKYGFEYELEAGITHGFRHRGASGHGFDPVVAGGANACTAHYLTNNAPLKSGDLVVMDVGARVDGYSADLARTVCLGNKPSRRQQQIYQAVLEAQDFAYSLLKPAAAPNDYEKEMETYMGEKLRELGLIKTITSEAVREFFPHRVSHFLGIDTHDAGDYDSPLAPGAVLAVEPGIYVPREGIGVRVEDNVVITEDGVEVLSKKLSREL